MTDSEHDIEALQQAFAAFTQSTRTMEESYRRMHERVAQLDQELAEKNRELALTTDYLNSILDSMSDGVIAVDTDGVVTTFNRAAAAILGYPPDDVLGQTFRRLFNREFPAPRGGHAMTWRASDGRNVMVVERDAPLADRGGKRIGAVKVFQDLTEIEALRERVRQQDRLAAVGEMAATVAHEIRNPLGGIRGFAALLARDIEEGDPRERLVQKILVGTKELERVVGELLEYTRPIQVHARPCTWSDLVGGALAYVELDGRKIEVLEGTGLDAAVLADPDRIRQVLLNMLLNAVQSIEGEGRIRVYAVNGDDRVALAVEDSGCGMTPAQLQQAFSPFYTTKEKGTGLGLAIAAKIIEAHGGEIEAESEPGNGSTFYVWLPRVD